MEDEEGFQTNYIQSDHGAGDCSTDDGSGGRLLSRSSVGVSSSFADVALTDGRWVDHSAGSFTHLLAVSSPKTRGLVGSTIHPGLCGIKFSNPEPCRH